MRPKISCFNVLPFKIMLFECWVHQNVNWAPYSMRVLSIKNVSWFLLITSETKGFQEHKNYFRAQQTNNVNNDSTAAKLKFAKKEFLNGVVMKYLSSTNSLKGLCPFYLKYQCVILTLPPKATPLRRIRPLFFLAQENIFAVNFYLLHFSTRKIILQVLQ